MPNNISFMKSALKLALGLADVGAPHGDGDGPVTPPGCLEGLENFQITNFTMPTLKNAQA